MGSEVRGNNTADGADGKTVETAFAFAYPYTAAAELYFTVSVVVGNTRSNASAVSTAVVVGECAGGGPQLGWAVQHMRTARAAGSSAHQASVPYHCSPVHTGTAHCSPVQASPPCHG